MAERRAAVHVVCNSAWECGSETCECRPPHIVCDACSAGVCPDVGKEVMCTEVREMGTNKDRYNLGLIGIRDKAREVASLADAYVQGDMGDEPEPVATPDALAEVVEKLAGKVDNLENLDSDVALRLGKVEAEQENSTRARVRLLNRVLDLEKDVKEQRDDTDKVLVSHTQEIRNLAERADNVGKLVSDMLVPDMVSLASRLAKVENPDGEGVGPVTRAQIERLDAALGKLLEHHHMTWDWTCKNEPTDTGDGEGESVVLEVLERLAYDESQLCYECRRHRAASHVGCSIGKAIREARGR